jgi:hypothetical protein
MVLFFINQKNKFAKQLKFRKGNTWGGVSKGTLQGTTKNVQPILSRVFYSWAYPYL